MSSVHAVLEAQAASIRTVLYHTWVLSSTCPDLACHTESQRLCIRFAGPALGGGGSETGAGGGQTKEQASCSQQPNQPVQFFQDYLEFLGLS